MKIKCNVCRREIEIDPLEYNPGETVTVRCGHCANRIEVVIPQREKPTKPEATVITHDPAPEEVMEGTPYSATAPEAETESVSAAPVEQKEKEKKKPAPRRKPKPKVDAPATSATVSWSDDIMTPPPLPPTVTEETTPPSPKKRRTSTQQPITPPPSNDIPTPPASSSEVGDGSTGTSSSSNGNNGCGCSLVIWIAVIAAATWGIIWCFRSCDSEEESNQAYDSVAVDTLAAWEEVAEEAGNNQTVYIQDTVYLEEEHEFDMPSASYDEDGEPSYDIMGFHNGRNKFKGDMIHTDGRRFPFELSLTYSPSGPTISDIVYLNTSSGTRLKLTVDGLTTNSIRLIGRDGGKDFILEFSGHDPYSGDAWWGDFHQDIEMELE